MSNNKQNIEIIYHTDEIEENKLEFNISELLYEIENSKINYNFSNEITIPEKINYNKKYTLKELLLICEYYGFAKDMKSNKYNKEEIIQLLVDFEENLNNYNIVFKRQHMWFYINELKKDKFMKKFLLW